MRNISDRLSADWPSDIIDKHPTHAATPELQEYAAFRQSVMQARLGFSPTSPKPDVTSLLNGAASHALDKLVERKFRSSFGMFFSGQAIASLVASKIKNKLQQGASVADPACGAGDLLLACLEHMPIVKDKSFAKWGEKIYGLDIHSELAAVTRERIALFATISGIGDALPDSEQVDWDNYLPSIRANDYFHEPQFVASADCVVMNPPFLDVPAPGKCEWSSGKVQLAGLFMESVVIAAKAGQEIVAILPDVLRSGSRYGKWRKKIAQYAEILEVEVYGRFDAKTDVDVFILHLEKRSQILSEGREWKTASKRNDRKSKKIGDCFDVSVGAVVPHRHSNKGAWFPYVDVAGAPRFGETLVEAKLRWDKTATQGPFLVVRRTSSPSDPQRLVTTVILNTEPVAVENHLIVLRPKDSSVETCRRIASYLQKQSVTNWLNKQIRCRHLTTKVIKELRVPVEELA
ncbi:N-6 DNA methylase [Herbaspirillum huttiense]|uniref:N-6 DNA methylase n=1 Tax=Herbaspirillum huttiense TaxID=863372 RepID=UPI00381CFFC7